MKEVNGDQYILTIDFFDSFNVYIVEDGNANFLHGTQFFGINEDLILKTTDHFY